MHVVAMRLACACSVCSVHARLHCDVVVAVVAVAVVVVVVVMILG